MKFECPKCGKKYSLPDEKIPQGKDFKVKCKKCAEVIILHGGASSYTPSAIDGQGAGAVATPISFPPSTGAGKAAEDEQTKIYDYARPSGEFSIVPGEAIFPAATPAVDLGPGPEQPQGDEAEWHVAVDGEQGGPYTAAQMHDMFAQGQIDQETFLWRDGYQDWIPLRESPEFQDLVAGAAQAAPQAAMPAYAQEAFSSQPPAPQADAAAAGPKPVSLFSEALSRSYGAGAALKAEAKPKPHDLFKPKQTMDDGGDYPFEGQEAAQGVITSSPVIPRGERMDSRSLKAARHEDSVLFSLQSLQSLAASSKEPPKMAVPHAEGGSGLIDIRRMAGIGGAPAASEVKTDDFINMGGVGFGATLQIPAILQPPPKKSNALLYVLGGAAVFSILCLCGILVAVFVFGVGRGGKPDEEALAALMAKEAAGKGPDEVKPVEQPAAQAAGAGQAVATNVTPPPAGEAAAAAAAGEPSEGTAGADAKVTKKKAGGGGTGSAGTKKTAEAKTDTASSLLDAGPSTTTTTEKKTSKSADSLLALIDEATSKKSKGGGTATEKTTEPAATKTTTSAATTTTSGGGGAGLPDSPTKNDILNAMKSVTPKVKACAKGQTGEAKVSIVIAGETGKVTSASVLSGPFAGTPAASCIAGAVKTATFPKFKKPKFTVTYPFVVK